VLIVRVLPGVKPAPSIGTSPGPSTVLMTHGDVTVIVAARALAGAASPTSTASPMRPVAHAEDGDR
jgi:hypothetical protein